MNENKYSYGDGLPCEYDHYPIPDYDPTIPPKERAERIRECDRKLDELFKNREKYIVHR